MIHARVKVTLRDFIGNAGRIASSGWKTPSRSAAHRLRRSRPITSARTRERGCRAGSEERHPPRRLQGALPGPHPGPTRGGMGSVDRRQPDQRLPLRPRRALDREPDAAIALRHGGKPGSPAVSSARTPTSGSPMAAAGRTGRPTGVRDLADQDHVAGCTIRLEIDEIDSADSAEDAEDTWLPVLAALQQQLSESDQRSGRWRGGPPTTAGYGGETTVEASAASCETRHPGRARPDSQRRRGRQRWWLRGGPLRVSASAIPASWTGLLPALGGSECDGAFRGRARRWPEMMLSAP